MYFPTAQPWAEGQSLDQYLQHRGVSRREFLTFCGQMAAILGLGELATPRIARALSAVKRPSIIWLSLQECTGCTESVLRTGFHERLHTWWPGLEEVAGSNHTGVRPVLVTPRGAATDEPWWTVRDREEELVTIARQASGIYPQAGGTRPIRVCGKNRPHSRNA